jgi:hypothetical protein
LHFYNNQSSASRKSKKRGKFYNQKSTTWTLNSFNLSNLNPTIINFKKLHKHRISTNQNFKGTKTQKNAKKLQKNLQIPTHKNHLQFKFDSNNKQQHRSEMPKKRWNKQAESVDSLPRFLSFHTSSPLFMLSTTSARSE